MAVQGSAHSTNLAVGIILINIVSSERIKSVVNSVIISDTEMDGVKDEPDLESDKELAAARCEPQFIKVKEEHVPEDDDDEISHIIRSDEDLSDTPDEEMAEAVMFPIVKTEYDTADSSQKDGTDEHAFGTANSDDKVTCMINTVYPLLLYNKVQGQKE
jgi:hypothetical protein